MYEKRGVCFQIFIHEDIIANMYYPDVENKVEILKMLEHIIEAYNENKLYSENDEINVAITMLSYKKNENTRDFLANLSDKVLEYYVDKLNKKINIDTDSRDKREIATTIEDITNNAMNAKYLIYINMDNMSICFKNYSFNVASNKDFYLLNVGVNREALDTFNLNMEDFKFYEVHDMLLFHMSHSIDLENYKRKYFLIEGDHDNVYSLKS